MGKQPRQSWLIGLAVSLCIATSGCAAIGTGVGAGGGYVGAHLWPGNDGLSGSEAASLGAMAGFMAGLFVDIRIVTGLRDML